MSLFPSINQTETNKNLEHPLIFSIKKVKNQKKWSKEEDELLIQLAEKYKAKNWKEISKQFAKKNSLQCFSRYKRIRPGIIKGSWKKEEDLQIIDLVSKYGKAWSKLSKILGTRNGKQIRDRYINILDPEIQKGKFTEEEDNMLIKLYYKYGTKWATIAKYFSHRTADMVKNRFHSCIKKKLCLNESFRAEKLFDKDSTYNKTSSHFLVLTSTEIDESIFLNRKRGKEEEDKSRDIAFAIAEDYEEPFFSNNFNFEESDEDNMKCFDFNINEIDIRNEEKDNEFNQSAQDEFNLCYNYFFKM